jgi:hypothetical protein
MIIDPWQKSQEKTFAELLQGATPPPPVVYWVLSRKPGSWGKGRAFNQGTIEGTEGLGLDLSY